MKKEKFEQIQKQLSKLSALFAAVGSIAISVEQTGLNSSAIIGDNIGLISNLNYLSEIKDTIIDEITDLMQPEIEAES